jgi:hypothetical protein
VLTTDRCVPFRALYVGTGGNLTIRLLDGSTHTLMNVPTGTTLRLQFDMVFETGTTATDLVGL